MPATEHRVVCLWPDGSFVSSLTEDFHGSLQALVADLGPPDRVEFRAHAEGWEETEAAKSPAFVDSSLAARGGPPMTWTTQTTRFGIARLVSADGRCEVFRHSEADFRLTSKLFRKHFTAQGYRVEGASPHSYRKIYWTLTVDGTAHREEGGHKRFVSAEAALNAALAIENPEAC